MNISQLIELNKTGKLVGLFEGIENDPYHAGPGEGSTNCKRANRSIAHYLASSKEQTPAMLFGSQAHALILEGEKAFASRYFIIPEGKTRASKEFKDMAAENPDKDSMSFNEYNSLLRIVESFDRHPIARELVTGGIELAAYWKDPETGLLCKAKADCFRHDGMIVDVKTTEDASPDKFPYQCAQLDYALSAAFYLDGFRHAIEQSCNKKVTIPDAFIFLAVEKSDPYGIAVYAIEPADLQKGRVKYERALSRIKEYKENGSSGYAGYLPQIQTITLPPWA